MNIRAKIFGGVADEPLLRAKKPKGAKADTLHSVSVARESRQRANSRGEDRHRLSNEQARITHEGRDHEVELVNLSGGGAMIAAGFEPMLWDRIDLHLGHHGTIECRVCWIRDGRIGLEFAHETRLDWPSDQVATVLRHVIERTFPHIAFPERQEQKATEEAESGVEPSWNDDEHRASSRHPLIWNATLHHNYQSSDVRIRNISSTGAMIETSDNVSVGTEPLLELSEAISLSATVEWVVGDQVGLRFHSEFDLDLLAETRPTVAPVEWMPPSYLNVSKKADDQSAERWNRLSVPELQRQLDGFLKH